MPQPLHEHLAAARRTLLDAGFRPEDAALDADILARHVLGWDLARLVAHVRDPAPDGFAERLEPLLSRRAQREPVAMITGHREFWGLDFAVTRATLVPRPETELIVEAALDLLPADAPATVVDIGTGSGCLAIAIAIERRRARVIATDVSHEALLVARRNADAHGVSRRVHFVRGDLATPLALQAQLIVANPPYVPEPTARSLPTDVVRYEPATALFGGADGLSVMRRLFETTRDTLAVDGTLIVEFGYGQEDEVTELAAGSGWHVAGMLHDLQGIARTILIRR